MKDEKPTMLSMPELHPRAVLVSAEGGYLDMISPEGEVVSTIYVPPGRVRASYYTDLLQPGFSFQISSGLVSFPPRSRVSVTDYGAAAHLTDANPDYRPASDLDQQMRATMRAMLMATTRTERATAAQEDVLRRRLEADGAYEAQKQAAALAASEGSAVVE